MNLKPRKLKPLLPLVLLFTLTRCVTVPNVELCAANGLLSNGALCAESNTQATEVKTFDQFVLFLEADIPNNRGASICMSTQDFNGLKTALQQACKEAGNCNYSVAPVIGVEK